MNGLFVNCAIATAAAAAASGAGVFVMEKRMEAAVARMNEKMNQRVDTLLDNNIHNTPPARGSDEVAALCARAAQVADEYAGAATVAASVATNKAEAAQRALVAVQKLKAEVQEIMEEQKTEVNASLDDIRQFVNYSLAKANDTDE